MKKIFTTIVASLLVMQYATAWTGSLHAGIAAIAHDNLTEQTKKGIVEILDGRSIIYAASLPTSHNQNIAIAPNGKVLSAKKAVKSKRIQNNLEVSLSDELIDALTKELNGEGK